MSFTFAEPRHLWLEISLTTQTAAWQSSQQLQAPGARWQVYLNQLCVHACLQWFKTDISPTATAWPAPDANPISWELVTGSCIQFDGIKLVLIPTDTVGQEVLEVPQEWVDIPGWAADYYLAVKVNPDEGWVEIWGYATHRQLKIDGEYDGCDRTYSLDAEDLTSDINVLWATIDHCPIADLKANIQTDLALAEVSTAQGDNLVARLANPNVAFPRLAIPFAQWGAMLANEVQRQALYTQRLNALQGNPINAAEVSLTQYLQGVCDVISAGWQSIETVFSLDAQQLAFRAERRDEETTAQHAKLLQFGPELDNLTVRLALMWKVLPDERIEVQAQVYPSEDHLYLPENLDFRIVSATGEVIQALKTEATNNYIQIQRIRCPMGYQFRLELEFEGSSLIEYITV